MSHKHTHAPVVGNDFVHERPRLGMAVAGPLSASTSAMVLPVHHVTTPQETVPVYTSPHHEHVPLHQLIRELAQRYSFIILVLLFLAVAGFGIKVGSHYWSARIANRTSAVTPVPKPPTIAGLNLRVPAAELPAKIESIINQPATLTVGDQTKPVSPEVIKSWLQITPGSNKSEHYIRIKADVIAKSLNGLAAKYNKEPVNQVTVNHGGVEEVVITGRNGTRSDPNALITQASAVAKTVLDAKGLQFSTPLETVPFQAVTPASFNKLIEVDVVSKHMWLYENGQLWRSYPISAGAPATPTIIGQFKTYTKLANQDMRGFNANGTRYFQPNVKSVMYFYKDYGIHGNYWRPRSWFGAVNSSHGCVSLPEYQAKEVYDWAPVGTTVITHY